MKSLISLRFWVDCLIIKVWVLIIEFFLTLRWLSLRREGNEMCNRTSQKDWSTLTPRSTLRKRVGFLHTFGRVIHYVQVVRTERCASVKGTPFLEGVRTYWGGDQYIIAQYQLPDISFPSKYLCLWHTKIGPKTIMKHLCLVPLTTIRPLLWHRMILGI